MSVRVRPLAWDDREAQTPFGRYLVEGQPGYERACLEVGGRFSVGIWRSPTLPTEADAMAAAQVDYEARILSAIAAD